MSRGKWQIISRRDLFKLLPHSQMHDDKIGNADAGSGKRRLAAFYVRAADNILINGCQRRRLWRLTLQIALINWSHALHQLKIIYKS